MGILDLDLAPRPRAATKIDAIFLDPAVTAEYKEHLLVALIHPSFTHASIHRELAADGHTMGLSAIKEYRSKLSRLVKANLTEDSNG